MLTSIPDAQREAQMQYFDGHYKMVVAGAYVICAATERKIPVEILRYWSVDLQEAYYDAEASHARVKQLAAGDG